MSAKIKIWLMMVALAVGFVFISQMLLPNNTVAQDPNPNPTPDPQPTPVVCATCCEMQPGGHTIGGPGQGGGFYLFLSARPRNICVTIWNGESDRLSLVLYGFATTSTSGTTTSDPVAGRTIGPGENVTVCDSRTSAATVDCDTPPCEFRWRIDSAQ